MLRGIGVARFKAKRCILTAAHSSRFSEFKYFVTIRLTFARVPGELTTFQDG